VIPAHTGFSGLSTTCLALFLLAITAAPILIFLAGRPRARSRRPPVWDGGILEFRPRMEYTATTFANPVRVTFERCIARASTSSAPPTTRHSASACKTAEPTLYVHFDMLT
jgi:hypothetical protein